MITAYTDGSSSSNGGLGAAACLTYQAYRREIGIGFGNRTLGGNNSAELIAVGLVLWVTKPNTTITIWTDSRNVIGWLYGLDTQTMTPDPSKRFKTNDPIIEQLVRLLHQRILERTIIWNHLRGHAGNTENAWADKKAGELRQRAMMCHEDYLLETSFWRNGSLEERPLDLTAYLDSVYDIVKG